MIRCTDCNGEVIKIGDGIFLCIKCGVHYYNTTKVKEIIILIKNGLL